MKRHGVLVLLLLLLGAGTARAGSVDLGVFGGSAIPVLQDDNGSGSVLGARLGVRLVPLVTVEPWFGRISGGNKDRTIDELGTTVSYDGIDVTSYGANLLLTFGGRFALYPYAGIGSATMKRAALDETRTLYDFGLGLSLSPLPKLTIHVRGELDAAVDGDASRKWATATAGVSYSLFSIPTP